MSEYGLFNDEGCVERGFYSAAQAEMAMDDDYSPDDELTVRALCPDHDEQAADCCEECEAESDGPLPW